MKQSRRKPNPFNEYECSECKNARAVGVIGLKLLCLNCMREIKGDGYGGAE